ncbi:MAG: type II toxin-antitoxin system HicB family antitoxin [Thermoproteota archaeon]|nr:MAG: type II toxin-antitoxin system HicB family antitoxin [Candidatus Korarchaeota archaeon]
MAIIAILWKEEDMYVIQDVTTGVTTQGETLEKAIENLKEAISLYLEEASEDELELQRREIVAILRIEG